MVHKSSLELYYKTLLYSLVVVVLFFATSMVFNYSLANTQWNVVDESFSINRSLFLDKGYLVQDIDQFIEEINPAVKDVLKQSDSFQINNKIYRNFSILSFKWIGFSSIFVAFANHTYYNNLLFKKIRLINGDKKIYGWIPIIYSFVIFSISALFAFSLLFISVYTYDEFFSSASFIYYKMFVPIIIEIIFSTCLYVFLAVFFTKRSSLITMIIIFNFMIPFITTILAFSSKNGYLYLVIFSFFDSSSILISMLKSAWIPGYEIASTQPNSKAALEFFRLLKKVVDKDEIIFQNWWLFFPIGWSFLYIFWSIKLIFFKKEKYV